MGGFRTSATQVKETTMRGKLWVDRKRKGKKKKQLQGDGALVDEQGKAAAEKFKNPQDQTQKRKKGPQRGTKNAFSSTN